MKKYNILLGFIGYILSIGAAPPLFIEGHYVLGALSLIAGVAVIDYNRDGQ
jgi:hypothetical protein